MDVKSLSTEKLIDPSGKVLLVSLLCVLTLSAIAVEYVSSSSPEQQPEQQFGWD